MTDTIKTTRHEATAGEEFTPTPPGPGWEIVSVHSEPHMTPFQYDFPYPPY